MERLFEDKHIVICIKPAGVLSEEDGMPRILAQGQPDSHYFCVHRLDKDVGGIMVYAKSSDSAARLTHLIGEKKLKKEYLAVVIGSPQPPNGVMKDLLYRDAARNKSFVVKRQRRGVREAELDYDTLAASDGMSLVHITLRTGRSHQIRVQFSHRATPLVGDAKYGGKLGDTPLALWSARLSLPHPFTGELISYAAAPPSLPPWTGFDTEKFII